MNLLKMFSRSAKPQASGTRPGVRRCRPELESLEGRLALSRTAVLVFGGEYLTKSEMQSYWRSDYGTGVSVASFRNLYTNAIPYLDMTGEGNVNGTDADLAIDQIVKKVRQDFAPYDLNVVVGDEDDYEHLMTDSQKGDVMVMVGGSRNYVEGKDAYGISYQDDLNQRDQYAFVFGRTIADDRTTAASFINHVARSISHEMGHTFGLEHVVADSSNDASTHHIMSVPSDTDDDRDFGNDFNFQNITYNTEAGYPQNAHTYLNMAQVLGHSTKPWAAVLNPGILTLHAEGGPASFSVTQTTDGKQDWLILDWTTGKSYHLDPDSFPDINSLNPFDTSITWINFYGSNYNDFLFVDNAISARVWAYGHGGNDTLYGGGEDDYLYGDGGHDHLYGQGGVDRLHGGYGNDYLDGGHDHVRDYVYSQDEDDTIVQHYHWVWYGSLGFWAAEDYTDFNPYRDQMEENYWWD